MTHRDSIDLPAEMSPENYIEKVRLANGEIVEDRIQPKQLLVHTHRDYHAVDVYARFMMSRVVKATGDEDRARRRMKEMRALGRRTSEVLARMIGERDPERVSKLLFGLKEKEFYFRYKKHHWSSDQVEQTLARLREEATKQLERTRVDGNLALRVLLTGGTGFVGKEILWQAAHAEDLAEVIVLIRPKEIRDRKTGELLETLSPQQRGRELMRQLWLDTPEKQAKFRFISGDVEQPNLGISDQEVTELQKTLTHVIHCAASVAFDDPYDRSFLANVTGSLNALRFSEALQKAPESPFVSHVAIETSYIHGRQTKVVAREDEIVFPRNFYNNYYELTKAMASIDTERFILDKGLRVTQLCPAIVIGESRAGNNRGDTKVVNAPVNVFGRAGQALGSKTGSKLDRSKASALARMACVFPGDPSAQINLITVDRVVDGILAALTRPLAVGERIHLATNKPITSQHIRDIVKEELDVDVKLAEPTIHRNVTLPLLTRVLKRLRQQRIAVALEKLGTIFGGYAEWGQPVHEVGRDARILGLTENRPSSVNSFRMLCRHNRHVQEFGKVRDLDEVSRREKLWWDFIVDLEKKYGHPAGQLPAAEFRQELAASQILESFGQSATG